MSLPKAGPPPCTCAAAAAPCYLNDYDCRTPSQQGVFEKTELPTSLYLRSWRGTICSRGTLSSRGWCPVLNVVCVYTALQVLVLKLQRKGI